jgi:hypothetical protein
MEKVQIDSLDGFYVQDNRRRAFVVSYTDCGKPSRVTKSSVQQFGSLFNRHLVMPRGR